ncbi:class I SAM-dependent methyltransferase [Lewinella sp. LCG006]|uniref:class I SAM-dependent methyltransferase n=1 Tax=Lewinella sp. LCG006 TaxID=3231911 RepID=UPI0034607E86
MNWKIRCPRCHQLVDFITLSCGGEDCLASENGVVRLFTDDFYQGFHWYEQHFIKARAAEGVRIIDTSVYEQLPFLDNVLGRKEAEWKAFREDLAIIARHLAGQQQLRVLNFGSWNGWLSNNLVKWGHQPLAIAYFADKYDGLGAQQFYNNQWESVQMDIEGSLAIIEDTFDVIILNRGVAFLVDPAKTVGELMNKLTPGGQLIITGLNHSRDTTLAARRFQQHRRNYLEKHGFELLFTPTKGYLSLQDIKRIRELGVQLKPYPNKLLQNIRAQFWKTKPAYAYGYFVNL